MANSLRCVGAAILLSVLALSVGCVSSQRAVQQTKVYVNSKLVASPDGSTNSASVTPPSSPSTSVAARPTSPVKPSRSTRTKKPTQTQTQVRKYLVQPATQQTPLLSRSTSASGYNGYPSFDD